MSVTDILISVTSFALFFYWFQYVCLLILRTRTSHDYSGEVASANQLGFPEVQSQLRSESPDLDSLHRRLERDYAILTYLLNRTPSSLADDRREVAMLKIHYRAMSAWFRFTRRSMRQAAQQALEEMSLVIVYLANSIGERNGPLASAGGFRDGNDCAWH
ncbi:MAG TPA: hypothetical protein VGJ09_07255 [Bryobacteraceae bacterium]|jgi:hypothetical protein